MGHNYARLLSEGVGGWLQFETACSRDGLFNEKYLTASVGQVLSANAETRVLAEYKHPALSAFAEGPGRRPEIDFVVCDPYPSISIAVEAKWVGTTTPKYESIAWDLIRLELLASKGARAFFVIAGQRRSLEAYFAKDDFRGSDVSPARPMLRTDHNTINRFGLTGANRSRVKMLRKLFRKYQSFDFPLYVATQRGEPFPVAPKMNRYQVYCWEIIGRPGRDTFKPANSPALRQASSTTAPGGDDAAPNS